MSKYLLSILLILLTLHLSAQEDTAQLLPPLQQPVKKITSTLSDTVPASSAPVQKDSLRRSKRVVATAGASLLASIPVAPVQFLSAEQLWEKDTLFRRLFRVPYLPTLAPPVTRLEEARAPRSQDHLFYLLVGVVLFLAFIRASFSKFFHNLFRLFFQTSFRQKQSREQISQDNLPSMLMNLLFVLVTGLFITIVALQRGWVRTTSFWWLLFNSTTILLLIYVVKYLFIRFAGWVFGAKEASDTYSFIVFLVNKILAVMLVPLALLIAFSSGAVNDILLTLTTCLAGLLLVYRYAVSLAAVRKSLQVNAFHFFVYLCAVEIVPLLLIYKVLFTEIGLSI